MKLEIEYNQLANCINILDKLPLKGLKSIHRTRLSNKLTEVLQRVSNEQTEIQKEYFELDEEGNPKIDNELKYCKDKEAYSKTMTDFVTEKAVIDDGDSQVMLKSVKKSLEEADVEFDGREAYAYEYLYSALTDAEGAKETTDEDAA